MKSKFFIFSVMLLSAFAGLTGCSKEDDQTEVFYSEWFSPSSWSGVSGDYYFVADAPAVTKAIIDNGVVLAYCILVNDNVVARPLPAYTVDNDAIWDFDLYDIGKIRFTANTQYEPSITNLYRYVVIPGNSKLASTNLKGKTIGEISEMSYSDVCKALGIPE